MALVFLLLALPLGASSQSVSSCGAAGDHLKDVKITLSPDPIAKGTPFTIDVSGNLDADLTALNADIDLNIKALGIINEPIKASSPLTISPGIAAGAQTLSVGPVTLPSLPGSVEAVGTVTITNDKKEPVACIKLNLNVPAESKEEAAPQPALEASAQDSKVTVCSAASDHLHNLAWSTASDVTTVSGSLDEAVTKLAVDLDLKVKVSFFSEPVKMTIPISYSPGLVKGDLKITAGPPSNPSSGKKSPLEVTGTVKIADGASEEIACLSIAPAASETITV